MTSSLSKKFVYSGRSKDHQGYIVNFLRDRDSYVIPRALASRDQLASLVTDFYFSKGPTWRRRILPRLADHQSREISPERVEECLTAAAVQFFGGRNLSRIIDTSYIANRLLARRTAMIWRRRNADLLLYSGYARDAFRAAQGSASLKLLFLYHPHYQIIRDLLKEDAERFPESAKAQISDREVTTWWRWKFADEEIELADGVITASQFSSLSLSHAGFRKHTSVVPYFSKLRADAFNPLDKVGSKCRFLFVGQGVIRKGIHHLFRAWRMAKLPNAQLTCICGHIDPDLAACTPEDVILRSYLSLAELQQEYSRSHVFVMPSIVEGFGLVYDEARSYGNFVIYTPNTGAPDMKIPDTGGRMVPVGNISSLSEALDYANSCFHSGELDFPGIALSAHNRGWERYVAELVSACDELREAAR